METYFAPAERADRSVIENDYHLFTGFKQVNSLINALPVITAILNEQRQIVYGNKPLLEAMGFKKFEEVIGMRPGELIDCIHAKEMPAGCGTSESCRVCGAVNAIQDCLKTNTKFVNECRITVTHNDSTVSLDFKITASPFRYEEQRFVVLSFEDIADEKRRLVLERLFFHDIINTAGGLRGFIQVLETTDDPAEQKEFTKIASRLSETLVEEILSQRQLLSAERGELMTNFDNVEIGNLIDEVILQMKFHQVSRNREIINATPNQKMTMNTDALLLKRVLVNLLKNAIEASDIGMKVTIGAKNESENSIEIWVKNETLIPKDIQLQIFQRSFSTKDQARGIGTYSIKMFTEQYLKGKVSFVSDEENMTVFSVMLPKS